MYMMLPKERRRNISGLVYAEDARKAIGECMNSPHGDDWYADLLSYMASLHVPCAVSPIHNDLYDIEGIRKWMERHTKDGALDPAYEGKVPKVGDVKPEHAHIMFCFPGGKTRDNITELMEGYCHIRETMWQNVPSVDGLLRYFCHLDEIDPAKKHYDVRDLYAFGGLDVSALYKTNQERKSEQLWTITKKIMESKMRHYSQLVRWAHAERDYETWNIVTGRASYFAAYFKGLADEKAEEDAKRKKEESERAGDQ